MSITMKAAVAVAMFAALAPSLSHADPCAQLAGARWLQYSEGPFGGPTGQNSLAVGMEDFRRGVVGGVGIATLGQLPIVVGAGSALYGSSTADKANYCIVLTPTTARVGSNSGGATDWTVSADGKTATIVGAHANSLLMKGWATKVP